MKYLIQKGININDVQETGSTALHVSCYYSHKEIIKDLLLNGIDISIKNKYNNVATQEALADVI